MTDSTSSQTPLSLEPVDEIIRPDVKKAVDMVRNGDDFLKNCLEWRKGLDKQCVSRLIDLGIAIPVAAAADIEIDNADRDAKARLEVVIDALTSMIHQHNSSHLETVITDLDTATKRLDDTMFAFTVLGIFLALLQVLISVTAPGVNYLLLLILGLVMVLTRPLFPKLMGFVTNAATKLRSAAERANAKSRQG